MLFVISVAWAIANSQYRAAEYRKHLALYSGQVQGTVASHDTSSSLSISYIYSGDLSTPQYTNSTHSQSTQILVKYTVEGEEFELTRTCRGLIPQVGESVTVYYRPATPSIGELIESVQESARHARNFRYLSPDTIFLTGAMLSAGLWCCGYWKRKGRGFSRSR